MTRQNPLLEYLPSWVIDKLASRADFEKFINTSCEAETQTQASKLCLNEPGLFFTFRQPRPDKLNGGSGWSRAAQEIKKQFKKSREDFKNALVSESERRRNKQR